MLRSKSPTPRRAEGPRPLEIVVDELSGEVQRLADQVEVLRIALDDFRSEVEWAARNLLCRQHWAPLQSATNLPEENLANGAAPCVHQDPPIATDPNSEESSAPSSQGTLFG